MNWLYIMAGIAAVIWLIFTILERVMIKRQYDQKYAKMAEKAENDKNDYITDIYNAKVGVEDGTNN